MKLLKIRNAAKAETKSPWNINAHIVTLLAMTNTPIKEMETLKNNARFDVNNSSSDFCFVIIKIVLTILLIANFVIIGADTMLMYKIIEVIT